MINISNSTVMKNLLRLLLLICLVEKLQAQKLLLPEPVTNQASVALHKNETSFIYTFYGLDQTKKWSGVHNKVFRINLSSGESKQIQNIPDSMGRLASSASAIKNQAYIAGGYAILENGKEKSSKQLFIFNPQTENFTKGADLLIPIDDHIQSVWRDSLLYLVSGWSDSLNVRTVQVYNPSTNHWQFATSLPDEKTTAVFGGSGMIVGDTIYFLGGAVFDKFYPSSRSFYKGVINPTNPLIIKWLHADEYNGEFRYRSAAYSNGNKIYFFGGSNETYNYTGISYREKKPVQPNKTILIYDLMSGKFSVKNSKEQIMDLRNIVQTTPNKFYVAGGMFADQKLSNKVIQLTIE